jgi:hypothetical protein
MPFPSRLSHGKDLDLCFDTFSHTLNCAHVDIQIHVNIFFHRYKQFFLSTMVTFLRELPVHDHLMKLLTPRFLRCCTQLLGFCNATWDNSVASCFLC